MKKPLLILLVAFIGFSSCKKESTNPTPLPLGKLDPIKVVKELFCQNVALQFEFEQKIGTKKDDSLYMVISNMGEPINALDSINMRITIFRSDTPSYETISLIRDYLIDASLSNTSIAITLSKQYKYNINSKRIQVNFLSCKTPPSSYTGTYTGDFLIPKFRNGVLDTIPGKAKCLIDAEGRINLWLEGKAPVTNFITRNIYGNISTGGILAAEAYELGENFIAYMNAPNIAPPNVQGDLSFSLNYSEPQIIYNSDTCQNLIFNLKKN